MVRGRVDGGGCVGTLPFETSFAGGRSTRS